MSSTAVCMAWLTAPLPPSGQAGPSGMIALYVAPSDPNAADAASRSAITTW